MIPIRYNQRFRHFPVAIDHLFPQYSFSKLLFIHLHASGWNRILQGRLGIEIIFGKTLQVGTVTSNGASGGEDVSLHFMDWSSTWDSSNDYSAEGLTSDWILTKYINIYDQDGNLIYGYPRSGEEIPENMAPVGSINGPQLLTEGEGADFSGSESYDPDNGPQTLSYNWFLDNQPFGDASDVHIDFEDAGVYTVKLVVSDGELSSTVEYQVTVEEDESSFCDQASSVLLGQSNNAQTITIDGSQCFYIDPDDLPLWNFSSITVMFSAVDGQMLSGTVETENGTVSIDGNWSKG